VKCNLLALIDTGSPISFVKVDALSNHMKTPITIVSTVENKFRNLNNQPLDIIGRARVTITLAKLATAKHNIDLYVLKNNAFEGDMILGRDFLTKERLTLMYTPVSQSDQERIDLFASLPLCVEENHTDHDLERIINNNELEFTKEVIQRLKTLLKDNNKELKEIVNDGYSVQVKLKDTSIYVRTEALCAYRATSVKRNN